jgi:hypothetical protein
MNITLLKPCQQKKAPTAWISYPDGPGGREVLNLTTLRGRAEYTLRTDLMWAEQGYLCALQIHPFCKKREGMWCRDEITCDHRNGRTKGRHDDRTHINGVPNNHAVCIFCNTQKGSRSWESVAPHHGIILSTGASNHGVTIDTAPYSNSDEAYHALNALNTKRGHHTF